MYILYTFVQLWKMENYHLLYIVLPDLVKTLFNLIYPHYYMLEKPLLQTFGNYQSSLLVRKQINVVLIISPLGSITYSFLHTYKFDFTQQLLLGAFAQTSSHLCTQSNRVRKRDKHVNT